MVIVWVILMCFYFYSKGLNCFLYLEGVFGIGKGCGFYDWGCFREVMCFKFVDFNDF